MGQYILRVCLWLQVATSEEFQAWMQRHCVWLRTSSLFALSHVPSGSLSPAHLGERRQRRPQRRDCATREVAQCSRLALVRRSLCPSAAACGLQHMQLNKIQTLRRKKARGPSMSHTHSSHTIGHGSRLQSIRSVHDDDRCASAACARGPRAAPGGQRARRRVY